MNTSITLNVRDLPSYDDAQPPSFAVVDILPIRSLDGRHAGEPIKGRVLRLGDSRALRRHIIVPAGQYSVQVKFPSGDVIVETVDATEEPGGRASISFATDIEAVERRLGLVERVTDVVSDRAGKVAAGEPLASVRAERALGYSGTWFPVDVAERLRLPVGERFFEHLSEIAEIRDHPGLVRVETVTLPTLHGPLQRPAATHSMAAAELFGKPERVQATQIHGPKSDRYARWTTPMRYTGGARGKAQERTRYFVALDGRSLQAPSQLVACVPGLWSLIEGDGRAHTRVDIVREQEGTGRVRLLVKVEDPGISDVLAFMQAGDAKSAAALIEPALGFLFDKQVNPFAAAASAYALLFAKDQVANPYWPQWIRNLATRFPGLPDGMVLYSTLLLQTELDPDERTQGVQSKAERATDAVLEALRRGPPLYRLGLGLLASNVEILRSMTIAGATRELLDVGQSVIHQWRLRVDPEQPFCVFNVKGLAD